MRETPEEQAEIAAVLRQWHEDIAAGRCWQCHQPITAKVQVGRCIYAEPCGCRMGQGRLPGGVRRVEIHQPAPPPGEEVGG